MNTIDEWADNWNADPKPLRWTANPDDILAKIERARAAMDNTQATS